MAIYLDPNDAPGYVSGDPEWADHQAEEDDRRDLMLMGANWSSGYKRDDFGDVDDEFANFLDRGAEKAQRAMYAAEAAERARAEQRQREREEREREEREREDDQAGSSFFGRLHQSVVDLGRRKLCPNATAPNFPGENHAPCANFCGPGTRVYDRIQRGDQPVNSADAACKQHDLDYARIVEEQRAGKLTSEQVDQGAHMSTKDMIMLREGAVCSRRQGRAQRPADLSPALPTSRTDLSKLRSIVASPAQITEGPCNLILYWACEDCMVRSID
eukprot:COSAG01_NODE_11943_length_1829_cov_25.165896_2_plen_273_part_00